MLNHYETVFILTPVLSDEQMKETAAKYKDLLANENAKIVNEELWGMRKLAYTIEKKSSGFYILFEFEAEPTIVEKLHTQFRRDEKVIRFLTTKLDKYAVEYAAKRKSVKSNKEN